MDGRASMFVKTEDLLSDIPLDLTDKEKKETLIIVRDNKNMLALEKAPIIILNQKQKDVILAELKKVTESSMSGWTHDSQLLNLDKSIRSMKFNNFILQTAMEDKEIKSCILNLMLYAKYLLQSSRSDQQLEYVNQFKEKISYLMAKYTDFHQLMDAMIDIGGIFKIVPLAYHEIAMHDEALVEFRASELVGHNVAYKVAKNEDKYKRVVVVDKAGKVLENYSIKEIKVIKNDKRDLGLKGLILVPETEKNQPITPLYITWAGTHSNASMNADLERTPGEESYRLGEDQVLKQIITTIEEINKPVKIVICGHSLGGALSQLSFHSLQRIIAKNIKNEELQKKVTFFDEKFCQKLSKITPHHRDLSEIKIDPSLIKELSVDVWNSAGVLTPVVDHSNELAGLLVYSGIPLYANFGLVGGDMLQAIGQGCILNQVNANGVKIKILKINPSALTSVATLGAAGLTFFGSVGLFASFVCLGAIIVKALKDKKVAHTKHHFINGMRPEDAYVVYNSHYPDGSLNIEECKIIANELSSKSTSVVDKGMQLISDAFMQEERFQSELYKTILADKKADDKEEKVEHHNNLMNFLVSRLKSNITGDEARITKLLLDQKLKSVIHYRDNFGKTLLHYAIENGKLDFASALLDDPLVNVNQVDNENNYPMLIFMSLINSYLPKSQNVYQFGIKLLAMTSIELNQKNKNNLSVESIYNSWYWGGYYAKPFVTELAKRIKIDVTSTQNPLGLAKK